VKSDGLWYSTWRKNVQDRSDTIFILGDTKPTVGEIHVETDATPYLLDAWTGSIQKVLNFERNTYTKKLTIPLSLQGNQTVFIMLRNTRPGHDEGRGVHAVRLPQTVSKLEPHENEQISAHIVGATNNSNPRDTLVELSTGRRYDASKVAYSTAPTFELVNWRLEVEHWEAPSDLLDANIIAIKRNTTHDLTAPLPSWRGIESLQNCSGLGFYRASFNWPPSAGGKRADGAYIKLPTLLHAAKVFVNSKELPAIDPANPIVDIGSPLRAGQNEVTIVVPSTMWNYLRSISSQLSSSDGPPLQITSTGLRFPVPPTSDNGLVGSVVVTPYTNMILN
jgi:hypothetical protein